MASTKTSNEDGLSKREILSALRALRRGDFAPRMREGLSGIDGQIANGFNNLAEYLDAFATENEALRVIVGLEGRTKKRLSVPGSKGRWRDVIRSTNDLLDDIGGHSSEIAEVVGGVARGDLSARIDIEASEPPLRGDYLRHAKVVNGMVEQLSGISREVTRVATDVGVHGTLGAQAKVAGLSGAWRELTASVNSMADNLTGQVREIARVTTAVANGDLTQTINIEVRGELLELKHTINRMVEQLSEFADEVSRVAREVGTEGRLGGQAQVRGVSGVWAELTFNVNSMADNLTGQVRNIAEVASAVAAGDLTRKITVDARGEIQDLKQTLNQMVDQLNAFGTEMMRVSREVGVDGRLGGQAEVVGVRGTWKEVTESVNRLATNLTDQVRDISRVATAIAKGDLTQNVQVEVRGEVLELKQTINGMVLQLGSFADEVTRVARTVGEEGKLGGQADVRGVQGVWRELTETVNTMATNLTDQVRDIARVTTAVANGDLSQQIAVEAGGELLALKETINRMVGQLRSFADEVSRVAREVGTEGVLGGQARVAGIDGVWWEVTGNVNEMAANLTKQVRGIAEVVTGVANGDLSQALELDARGEIATLVQTINGMTATLRVFADQVTDVANEVGVEGRLGGQAQVPGAAGVWRRLTDNVNELAGNLTRQVRAIGEVATAVTSGDLTQSINVEARGEVAKLKDDLNTMIRVLAETTRTNEDQDWLKTHLTRFTRMLQGQRDLPAVARQVLSELAPLLNAQHGAFYLVKGKGEEAHLRLFSTYAFKDRKNASQEFGPGEGLVGQAWLERQRIVVENVPADYVRISSALGETTPMTIVVAPIVFEGEVKGVLELASLRRFTDVELAFLEQMLESLGVVVTTIEGAMRTDDLLRQSQGLTEELQTQQEELQQTNEELEEKARQLTLQKGEVERKNLEVESARAALEEKADQLAVTSRYKSEFLANMSHELRTPLNSLLILSHQLAENKAQNLEPKQVEYARTIHESGSDLLNLINEILDLAKIESGTMDVDATSLTTDELVAYLERSFRPIADEKGLAFVVVRREDAPAEIATDENRLKQVLRNLVANALKFTPEGQVELTIRGVADDEVPAKLRGPQFVAFAVRDTGIGIAAHKQQVVFEAFQQADGSTSRRFGGTGLGLSISREIAHLLGGEIQLESAEGEGSTFTLIVPVRYERPRRSSQPRISMPAVPTAPPALRGAPKAMPLPKSELPDDRGQLEATDRVLLVIEDDPRFAMVLLEQAHRAGYKCVIATTGEEGLRLAYALGPDGITLDLGLPDMDGFVLLDRLKHDSRTRHIPVQTLSGAANARESISRGAYGFFPKPATAEDMAVVLADLTQFLERRVKRLLVVEDDEVQRQSIVELIGDPDVEIVDVATGAEALTALDAGAFDCVVVDLKLPDYDGADLIRAIQERTPSRWLPVVVYTGRELSEKESAELRESADSVIVKDVRSHERLLDETALFLHRVEADLPEHKRRILRSLEDRDPQLQGKRVLVVDDDFRNVFAVTAILETHDVTVEYAENGRLALEKLEELDDVALVLMDIMMPEMDGYEAMRRIRKEPRWQSLPIIALTAKAMKGDREKCIDAGASDYVTKPVDPSQLVSLLRVWMY